MGYSDDFDELDKVVKNLFKRGNIISVTVCTPTYSVEVSKAKYLEAAKGDKNTITQIFNITSNATATANASVSLSQQFQSVIRYLGDSNIGDKKLSEAKKNLGKLEYELHKPNPNEKVIRKVMHWASNFGLEVSLRIAVLIAERLLKPI